MSVTSTKAEVAPETPNQPTRSANDRQLDAFVSPARVARVQEQKELLTLNKRLEKYIHQNREAEANQALVKRQLDQLRTRHEAELLRQRDRYEKELLARRQERDMLVKKCSKNQSEIDLLSSQLKEVTKNFESEQARGAELDETLEERTDRLNKEIERLKVESRHSSMRADKLQHKLDQARTTNQRLETDQKDLKARHDDAVNKLNDSESVRSALCEDLSLIKSQMDERSAADSREIASLVEKNDNLEQTLREEFSMQMSELTNSRVAQCEAEKDACLKEMKVVYDQKIAAFRDKVEQQQHEIAQKEVERKEMEHNFNQRLKKMIVLEHSCESLKNQVRDLLKAVDDATTKPKMEVDHLKHVIKRMKDAYKRKEVEFDSLMDIKIALSMEIKAYRMMLDSEEQRLGLAPAHGPASGNKRKRRDSSGNYNQSPSQSSSSGEGEQKETPQRGPALLISSVNIDEGSVSVRNCLTREVSLCGYSLSNANGESKFNFPDDFKLDAGGTVKVLADPKAEAHPPHTLAWNGTPFNASNGDKVVLVSPAGNVLAEGDIFHETSKPSCAMM